MGLYRLSGIVSFALIGLVGLGTAGQLRAHAQEPTSIPEQIEWTWEVRPSHPDPKLPNVLLVGDSITRNYFPGVTEGLTGSANVYLFAASTSVGDPRLSHQLQEFLKLEGVPFSVIHFNNGMHGWAYTEAQYKAAFPEYLQTLHSLAPTAKLIWATITPVRPDASNGATNPRVEARNGIANALVSAQNIPIDDQHELMTHHQDLYQDSVHFNKSGSAIQAEQVVKFIRDALPGAATKTSKPE
jgi:lysophospholipase L1-like esterase